MGLNVAGRGSPGRHCKEQKESLVISEAFEVSTPSSLICIISLQDLRPFLVAHKWLTQREKLFCSNRKGFGRQQRKEEWN